jgi:dihydroceramide fatty acyl 2-hydroxylase
VIYFGPFVGYGLYAGLSTRWWPTVAGLFVVGVLAWTLAEYLLHRFFFHLVVEEEGKKLPFFLVHGYHHEYPQDKLRLVAPFIASWTGGALFLLLYYLVAGPELCWPLFAGTGTGYVAYDAVHFYTHHARPRTRVGRWLQRYHLQHHYRDAESHFGISNPLWDLVFGTFSSSRSASAGAKAREEA